MAGAIALSFLGCPLALAQDASQGDSGSAMHQKVCAERYARKAGRFAYLEAKLALTEQQRPAWNKWRQTKLDAAEQRRTACLQHRRKGGVNLNAVEREARREKFLSARLAQLQASKPALQAFYDSLSPEQKAVFDQAEARHHPHHHRWRHGFHTRRRGWRHEGWHGEGHEGWRAQDREQL